MKQDLKWIVARPDDDNNWWVDETSDNVYWGTDSISLLDPNQVVQIRKAAEELEEYGFDIETLGKAFHFFQLSSELPDGRLKLVPTENDLDDEGVQLFAMPDLLNEDEGKYPELLDRLLSFRVKLINATHDFFQDVTEDDLEEEIQSRNADRYFGSTCIHVFTELDDILSWKPAEWDEENANEKQRSKDDAAEDEE